MNKIRIIGLLLRIIAIIFSIIAIVLFSIGGISDTDLIWIAIDCMIIWINVSTWRLEP